MAQRTLADAKAAVAYTRQIFTEKQAELGMEKANEAIQNEAPGLIVSLSLIQADLLLLIAQDLAAIRSYMEDEREDG